MPRMLRLLLCVLTFLGAVACLPDNAKAAPSVIVVSDDSDEETISRKVGVHDAIATELTRLLLGQKTRVIDSASLGAALPSQPRAKIDQPALIEAIKAMPSPPDVLILFGISAEANRITGSQSYRPVIKVPVRMIAVSSGEVLADIEVTDVQLPLIQRGCNSTCFLQLVIDGARPIAERMHVAIAPVLQKYEPPVLATAQVQQEPTREIVASIPAGERRIALVIGNGAYSAVAALPNPPQEASAIAEIFRKLGFETVMAENNLNRDGMGRALARFNKEARDADWAVVYYAGHGVEYQGVNRLVPIDAQLKDERDIDFETVSLDQVVDTVKQARKLGIVILDACRNDPFTTMKRQTATRAVTRGLARIEPTGSVLVAYSAGAGEVALDSAPGTSKSPFVSALEAEISTPGLEVGKLFRRVRDRVLKVTENKQDPAIYNSLSGDDFFFVAPK